MSRSSDSIFRRDYWLGEIDARVPALLRVALGGLVVSDLVDRLRDFHAFYAPGGILPGPGEVLRTPLAWSLWSLTSSRGGALALFLAGFPLALALLLGYRTRVAGVLLWVFTLSLHNRNPHVCDGGDGVLSALLFWSMFVDAGAALSLDVRLGRRAGRAHVPAFAFRLLQLQIVFVYLVTFLAKSGPSWRDGSAVLRAVQSSDWGRGLAPLLAQHPGLATVLTYATLAIEGAFPLLVLSPFRPRVTRAVAIVAGLALHAGIFLTMRVGIFSEVMPVSYLAFVPVTWIDRAQAALARRWHRVPPPPPPRPPPRPGPGAAAGPARPMSPAAVALAAVLAAQLALIVLDHAARAAGVRMPRPLAVALTLVGQRQNWRMFAPDAPMYDVTWRLPGRLDDGRPIELTETVIPELADHGGFAYSRWHRLRNSMGSKPPELLLPLGRYVCRRWSTAHPETPLARFELLARVRPALSPPGTAPTETVIFRQACHGA